MAIQLYKNGERISGSGVTINSAGGTAADVVNTVGAETVSDGVELITVATRDTAQDITARKTFQADIIIDTDLSMIADEGDPQPSQSIIFPGGSSIMENFTDAFGFGDSSSNELRLTSLADGGTTEVRIRDTGLSTTSGIRLGSAESPANNGITFEDGTSQTTAAVSGGLTDEEDGDAITWDSVATLAEATTTGMFVEDRIYEVDVPNAVTMAVPIISGGTGATTAELARTNLGITAPNIGDGLLGDDILIGNQDGTDGIRFSLLTQAAYDALLAIGTDVLGGVQTGTIYHTT